MTYVMLKENVVLEQLRDEVKHTSYRAVSRRINSQYPTRKISPSKLYRLASKQSKMSVKDFETLVNMFSLQSSSIVVEFPF